MRRTFRAVLAGLGIAAAMVLATVPINPVQAQSPASVRIITTDLGECRAAEVVINGVLAGHALAASDGYLSKLDEGNYEAIAQFFHPDLLLIRRAGGLADAIRIITTVEGTANNAETLSADYKAKASKKLGWDLSLAVDLRSAECTQKVSAIPKSAGKPRYTNAIFFEQLYRSTIPDNPVGSFSRPVRLSIERPVATEFRQGDHVFRSSGTVWTEFKGASVVAIYDEFARHLAGFDLRDREPESVIVLGVPVKTPRIVYAPSGFDFWVPNKGRKAIRVHRPTEDILLTGGRSDVANPLQLATVAVKSFIRKIIVDAIVDGQPVSSSNSRRLGFDDLVGGRNTALAFALATDASFSELPDDDLPGEAGYRLWSRAQTRAECSGNSIKTYTKPTLENDFGKEGHLSAEGKVSQPIAVTENRNGAGDLSIRLSYEIAGRPNAFTLPLFTAVRPRSCSWIWHAVEVDLQCVAGKLTIKPVITGSAFPSRRVWLNHVLVEDVDQGPFDRLWSCDENDGSRVK